MVQSVLMIALLLTTQMEGPAVEILTTSGPARSGRLLSASAERWQIVENGQTIDLPQVEILEARFTGATAAVMERPPLELHLADGSRLQLTQLTSDGQTLQIDAPGTGPLAIPRSAATSLRLGAQVTALETSWQELQKKERRQDLLVIRKGDALDFVEGAVGEITAASVSLVLDGEPVTVPRARVYGVLYPPAATVAKPAGFVELISTDRLAVSRATGEKDQWKLTLASGAEISVAMSNVKLLDFSSQRLTWLSALEARDIKHEFVFIDRAKAIEYDRDVWSRPLRLGNRTFSRGVCIRSKTSLRYRLNGDYSRLQALMGIQQGYAGDVKVTLTLDGRKLLEKSVTAMDPEPHRIDLDLTGGLVLDVLVDYGPVENDIGDHLILADARLLKAQP